MTQRIDSRTRLPHRPAAARVPLSVRLFSPVGRWLLGAGVPLGPNALVTVPGRTTGEPRTVALAVIETDGRRFVWSPFGETQWVRNLRAAGSATLTVHGRPEVVRAVELDEDGRRSFFRDRLGPLARSMRGGMTFIRLIDRVDLRDSVAAAVGRPAFELLPVA